MWPPSFEALEVLGLQGHHDHYFQYKCESDALQEGQRVAIMKDRVCEIRYHDTIDEDSE